MLVVADPQRRESLAALTSKVLPGASIESLDNVLDAILMAARRPPDLLLLDHSIDGAAAPALVTNLARVAPRTKVLVFDELADDEPQVSARSNAVRPWDHAAAALEAWSRVQTGADGAAKG